MARRRSRPLLWLVILVLALTACANSGGDGDAGLERPVADPPVVLPTGGDVPGDDDTDGSGSPAGDGDGEAAGPPDGDGSSRFNVEQVQVGDEVAGLRIEAVSAYGDPQQPPDIDFPSITVRFSGRVTVTGRFEHFPPDDEFFPEVVCFFPDAAGARRLPVMEGDGRHVWFCFDNVDEARQVFGEPGTGTATVTVDAYTINRYPSEVVNTATLLEATGIQR